jgi:hypothetical protein
VAPLAGPLLRIRRSGNPVNELAARERSALAHFHGHLALGAQERMSESTPGGLQVDRKGASSETRAPCVLPRLLA